MSSKSFMTTASFASLIVMVCAGFNPVVSDNIAVYWGQNSAGGANTQQRLSTYCASTLPPFLLTVIVRPDFESRYGY